MVLNIRELSEEGVTLDFALPPEELEFTAKTAHPADIELASPVQVHLSAAKYGRNVSLSGDVACQLSLVCSRCLKVYRQELGFALKRTFFPCPAQEQTGEKELELKDMEVSFYRGEEIAMDSVIKEELILALPFRPLCNEGCRGLCSGCGVNLNSEPCRCPLDQSSLGLRFKDRLLGG